MAGLKHAHAIIELLNLSGYGTHPFSPESQSCPAPASIFVELAGVACFFGAAGLAGLELATLSSCQGFSNLAGFRFPADFVSV